MLRSNTYNLFMAQRNNVNASPVQTARGRIKSLQKIKVSHKGLPTDFFLNKNTLPLDERPIKSHRAVTLPNQFDDIRVTPTFLQTEVNKLPQNRQYKSEQRIGSPTRGKARSPTFKVYCKQDITFCNSFFKTPPVNRPKVIDIKIKKKIESEREINEGALMGSPHKQELTELMRRKRLDKEKYPLLWCPRTQRKTKNKLPILKVRYPSAFGV